MGGAMNLGVQVVDRGLLDCDGRHAGKVDDLILEFDEPSADQAEACAGPRVVALVSGPTALSRNLSRPVQWLVRAIYRLLGVANPKPSEIAWENVKCIDVVVHLNVDREEAGWSAVGDAVNRRFIERLPWA
jgi:hypothetical protein